MYVDIFNREIKSGDYILVSYFPMVYYDTYTYCQYDCPPVLIYENGNFYKLDGSKAGIPVDEHYVYILDLSNDEKESLRDLTYIENDDCFFELMNRNLVSGDLVLCSTYSVNNDLENSYYAICVGENEFFNGDLILSKNVKLVYKKEILNDEDYLVRENLLLKYKQLIYKQLQFKDLSLGDTFVKVGSSISSVYIYLYTNRKGHNYLNISYKNYCQLLKLKNLSSLDLLDLLPKFVFEKPILFTRKSFFNRKYYIGKLLNSDYMSYDKFVLLVNVLKNIYNREKSVILKNKNSLMDKLTEEELNKLNSDIITEQEIVDTKALYTIERNKVKYSATVKKDKLKENYFKLLDRLIIAIKANDLSEFSSEIQNIVFRCLGDE